MRTTCTLRKYCLLFLTSMLSAFALQAQQQCSGVTASLTSRPLINLCNGSSVTLQAATSSALNFYQWQIQTSAGGPFSDITGANSGSYTTSTLGAYRIIVGNGTCRDTSSIINVVRLTLNGGTITGGSSSVICPNTSGGELKGTPAPGDETGSLTYQWQMSDASGNWTNIDGATGLTYITGLLPNTTSFRRLVMDNCGNSASSNVITINTSTPLNAGRVGPATQTIAAGSVPTALTSITNASGGQGAVSYTWQSSNISNGAYTDINGATGAGYAPGAQDFTIYFRRVATDAGCKNIVMTEPVEVLVTNPVLLKAGVIASRFSCVFEGKIPAVITTQVPTVGGVKPYTTQWEMSTNNVDWTVIPGASGETYQPDVLTQTTWFRKKVTDAAGTVSYAGPVEITLKRGDLSGGSILATSNVACLGSSPALIRSLTSAGNFGERVEYMWQMKPESGNWEDITGATLGDLIPEPISVKTTYRRVTVDGCGLDNRTAYSNEVEIDTRPALLAGDIEPSSQMIIKNGTPRLISSSIAPGGGTGSNRVWWEKATLAVGPWTTIGGATALNYQSPALENSTYFRRAVMDNGCLATKYTYVVEVFVNNAGPLTGGTLVGATCVFPGNRPHEIQQGDTVSGGMPPYTFSWERRDGNTGPWTSIAGAAGKFYHPPVLTTTTQFRRKATDAFGQTAYSDIMTINLLTTPINPGSIGIVGASMVCAGGRPGIIKSTAAASNFGEYAEYKWYKRTEGGSWTLIPGEIMGDLNPGTITERTYFRRSISDKCSGVSRTEFSNEVMFDILPPVTLKTGLVDGPFITCSGTAPGLIRSVLDACGSGANSYQWEMNTGSGWSTISGATGASYSPAAINVNTTFRRKVTDGCGNTGYSNEVLIYVYPPIEPGVIGNASQSVCANVTPAPISLLTNCHYTDGTVTYQWQSATGVNGLWTNIGGANGSSYQPAGASTNMYYRLEVRSTTCNFVAHTNVASVLIAACPQPPITGGVANPAGDETIKVYPNPVVGNTVNVDVETTGKVTIRLMAADGQVVPATLIKANNKQLTVKLHDRLANGTYLLQVFDGKKRWTQKIMIP